VVGKEIADAIAPIVMWVAIVGGVLVVLAAIRSGIKSGAVAKDDLGEALQAEKEKRDGLEGLRQNRRRLRDAWRRGRLPDEPPE